MSPLRTLGCAFLAVLGSLMLSACEPANPPPPPPALILSARPATESTTNSAPLRPAPPTVVVPPNDFPPAPAAPHSAPDPDAQAERNALAEAFDEFDLYCRESRFLNLNDDERAKVAAVFAGARNTWNVFLETSQTNPAPGRANRVAVPDGIEQARQKVQSILGLDRSLYLSTLRRSSRGGGIRFAARLGQALDSQTLTPEQSSRLEPMLRTLYEKVQQVPEDDGPDDLAGQRIRGQTRRLIDEARTALGSILSETQMNAVRQAVPALMTTGHIDNR